MIIKRTYAKCPLSASAAACTALTNWMVPIRHTRREAVWYIFGVCMCIWGKQGAF